MSDDPGARSKAHSPSEDSAKDATANPEVRRPVDTEDCQSASCATGKNAMHFITYQIPSKEHIDKASICEDCASYYSSCTLYDLGEIISIEEKLLRVYIEDSDPLQTPKKLQVAQEKEDLDKLQATQASDKLHITQTTDRLHVTQEKEALT